MFSPVFFLITYLHFLTSPTLAINFPHFSETRVTAAPGPAPCHAAPGPTAINFPHFSVHCTRPNSNQLSPLQRALDQALYQLIHSIFNSHCSDGKNSPMQNMPSMVFKSTWTADPFGFLSSETVNKTTVTIRIWNTILSNCVMIQLITKIHLHSMSMLKNLLVKILLMMKILRS